MRGSRRNKIHPAGIPQLSDPSPRYSRNIHTHTGGFRGIPAVPIPVHTSSGVRRMKEVNARQAWLVPGWVTVFGRVYHLGM